MINTIEYQSVSRNTVLRRNCSGNFKDITNTSKGMQQFRIELFVYFGSKAAHQYIYRIGLGDGKVKGMEGVDFAFYQGRSKYHTKYDSIPGANGAKESLWLMMESVRGAATNLLNDERTHVGSGTPEPPVYFDGQFFMPSIVFVG